MNDLTLSPAELYDLTRYSQVTKQLRVLHSRGFVRAYISRTGELVLERTHYEAVSRGESAKPSKSANLSFLRKSA